MCVCVCGGGGGGGRGGGKEKKVKKSITCEGWDRLKATDTNKIKQEKQKRSERS